MDQNVLKLDLKKSPGYVPFGTNVTLIPPTSAIRAFGGYLGEFVSKSDVRGLGNSLTRLEGKGWICAGAREVTVRERLIDTRRHRPLPTAATVTFTARGSASHLNSFVVLNSLVLLL